VKHSRNDSAMSVSTVATFATATEGEEMTEEEEDLLYWDRRFNHGTSLHLYIPLSQSNTQQNFAASPVQS
jgi:hypothetical protein